MPSKSILNLFTDFQSLSKSTQYIIVATVVSLILIAVAHFSLRSLYTTAGTTDAAKKKITNAKRAVTGLFFMMLISLGATYKALY